MSFLSRTVQPIRSSPASAEAGTATSATPGERRECESHYPRPIVGGKRRHRPKCRWLPLRNLSRSPGPRRCYCRVVIPEPVLVSWSSGKDSAWALHRLRRRPDRYDVRGVFTTVTDAESRVSVHKTPTWLLREQADRLALPLYEIPIPDPCSMSEYEDSMTRFLDTMRSLPDHRRASTLAFGDLFLDDIRKYREEKLAGTGFTPSLPAVGAGHRGLGRRDAVFGDQGPRGCRQPSCAASSVCRPLVQRGIPR